MNVIADDLIVFSGDDVGGEDNACKLRFYELLYNDADASAGYIIAAFVFFNPFALCRIRDVLYGIPNLRHANVS